METPPAEPVEAETPEPASPRTRLVIAGAAAALLAATVAAVLVLGGGSGGEALPEQCVESWNADSVATSYGAHNYTVGHDYRQILITRLDVAGGELVESDSGLCAVIFARTMLDSEPVAAGQVLRGTTWTPFSQLPGVEPARIEELQQQAEAESNGSLAADGTIASG